MSFSEKWINDIVQRSAKSKTIENKSDIEVFSNSEMETILAGSIKENLPTENPYLLNTVFDELKTWISWNEVEDPFNKVTDITVKYYGLPTTKFYVQFPETGKNKAWLNDLKVKEILEKNYGRKIEALRQDSDKLNWVIIFE